jgi:hypothetical protein
VTVTSNTNSFRCALIALLWVGTLAAQPALTFDGETQSVVVSGLDASLLAALGPSTIKAAFAVYFEDSQIPILGDYVKESTGLRFRPRFPFMPGRTHRAVLNLPGIPVKRLSFRIDPPALKPKAQVTKVFPSGDVVPANLLRIYVHFSHPMTRRGIARHVRLLDQKGEPVEAAFLEMEDGLWDPAGQRLTLFLHPGRIKRGLALHENMGAPLRPGFRYRLVIAQESEDEDGMPLMAAFSKEFSVVDEDRTSPDVHKWIVTKPNAGFHEPLIVRADKPMDAALFARLLRVEDAGGHTIAGDSSVEAQETIWRFVPSAPWSSGAYAVRIGAQLEDLAGNRPTRLFDEPASPNGRRTEAREVSLPFSVASRRHRQSSHPASSIYAPKLESPTPPGD